MTDDEARQAVAAVLRTIAPEVDLSTVPGDADLREEADLDSMDLLNLLTGIQERTGVAISDRDASRLATFDALVVHLVAASP
jgi:acyl carrier protein